VKNIVWLAAILVAGCATQGSLTTEVYLDDKGKFRYVPAEDVGTGSSRR
jgi:hypothetical protein